MGIFQPAMLVYQRVMNPVKILKAWFRKEGDAIWGRETEKLRFPSRPKVPSIDPQKPGSTTQDAFGVSPPGLPHHLGATKKTLITFHYTGWFIGIHILAHYNPYIIG